MVTTVSPRYSQEIRTPEHGCGLERVLDSVSDRLVGITNGIDKAIWNPKTDSKLFANYDVDTWREGKYANKIRLQEQFQLQQSNEIPLIGLVGRLASPERLGFDLAGSALAPQRESTNAVDRAWQR